MGRLFGVIMAAAMILGGLVFSPAGRVAAAADECQTFPETGKSACGLFLQYWQANGGLEQQGYPISEPLSEKSTTDNRVYAVQYFERARFEYHPEFAGTAAEVLLGQLGREQFSLKYGLNAPAKASLPGTNPSACVGICKEGVFADYWETHGGLRQQGVPVSNTFWEVSPADGQKYIVQYFERARFEYHPNQPEHVVMLGLMGSEQFAYRYPGNAYPASSPAPSAAPPSIVSQIAVGPGAFNDVPLRARVTETRTSPAYRWAGRNTYPNGVFFVVLMDIVNTGRQQTSIGLYTFYVVDSQGRRFEATDDMGAQLAASANRRAIYDNIPAGTTVRAALVFDIAKDAQIVRFAGYPLP